MMLAVVPKFDATAFLADLNVMVEDNERAALDSVQAGAQAAHDWARLTARFTDRSGELRKSLTFAQKRPTHWQVSARADYARYVESGTRQHEITSEHGTMLRFMFNGVEIFRESVLHPGTSGTGFMAEARDRGEQAFVERLERSMSRIFR